MTPRRPNRALGGAAIAGERLRVTQTFFAVALVLGFFAGRGVASTTLVTVPRFRSLNDALHAFDPGSPLYTVTHPSTGWVVVAGLGVALVYGLSVLAHELGHLAAARLVGVDVAAVSFLARRGRRPIGPIAGIVGGLLAGCGSTGGPSRPLATCGGPFTPQDGVTFARSALGAPANAELGSAPAERALRLWVQANSTHRGVPHAHRWLVLDKSPQRVIFGHADGFRSLNLTATATREGSRWTVSDSASMSCRLATYLPGRLLASLSLDAAPGSPRPTGRQLRIVLDVAACVKLGKRRVDVSESATRVIITASFGQLPGYVACAGQDPIQTAAIRLSAPLKSRRLLDGSTIPLSPITAHAIAIGL